MCVLVDLWKGGLSTQGGLGFFLQSNLLAFDEFIKSPPLLGFNREGVFAVRYQLGDDILSSPPLTQKQLHWRLVIGIASAHRIGWCRTEGLGFFE